MVASVESKNLGTQRFQPADSADSPIVANTSFAEARALEAARTQPEVIFFDAAGTLFEVRGSVGVIYCRIASQYGCEADAEHLQQNFVRWFRLQPPMAFPAGTDESKLHEMEKGWWRNLVRAVFADCGAFPHFEEFFDDVFERFRNAELWRVYDDVVPALTELKRMGIRLGVISNFDSRLYDVLEAVELATFFDSVHISTRVGAAKPDPGIFQAALAAHNIEPHQAWHVGDSLREDIEGAEAAAIHAILIDRDNHHPGYPARIITFNQIKNCGAS
ncbi:MAG: HAD-IA family hydrolase [Acidobacteria bacterium]|nr:HAD-IA family hydrolase [Acidobacteriota bacterium]